MQLDAKAFVAGRLSACYCHGGFTDMALLGQERYQMRVGLAIHRWGGDPDFEGLAMHPADLVLFRTGLDAHAEEQVRALPGIPTRHA